MVFTVVHPVVTSHDARAFHRRAARELARRRLLHRGAAPIPVARRPCGLHYRTVEQYVASFQRVGFRLTALSGCPPRPERFGDDVGELVRRRRIPLFLLLLGER
jgi:hypothetical protein